MGQPLHLVPSHRSTTSNVAQYGVQNLQAWVLANMFLNPPHFVIAVTPRGEVGRVGLEKRHEKWETWGGGLVIDNPAVGTPAQWLPIRGLQEAGGGPGEFMSCPFASGRSFDCAGHMKCWFKWEGKINEEEERCQREVVERRGLPLAHQFPSECSH